MSAHSRTKPHNHAETDGVVEKRLFCPACQQETLLAGTDEVPAAPWRRAYATWRWQWCPACGFERWWRNETPVPLLATRIHEAGGERTEGTREGP